MNQSVGFESCAQSDATRKKFSQFVSLFRRQLNGAVGGLDFLPVLLEGSGYVWTNKASS